MQKFQEFLKKNSSLQFQDFIEASGNKSEIIIKSIYNLPTNKKRYSNSRDISFTQGLTDYIAESVENRHTH